MIKIKVEREGRKIRAYPVPADEIEITNMHRVRYVRIYDRTEALDYLKRELEGEEIKQGTFDWHVNKGHIVPCGKLGASNGYTEDELDKFVVWLQLNRHDDGYGRLRRKRYPVHKDTGVWRRRKPAAATVTGEEEV